MDKDLNRKKVAAILVGLLAIGGGAWGLLHLRKQRNRHILATGEEPKRIIQLPDRRKPMEIPVPPKPDPIHVVIADRNGEGVYAGTSAIRHPITWYGRGKLISLAQHKYVGWRTGEERHQMIQVQIKHTGNTLVYWVHKDSVKELRGNRALQAHIAHHPQAVLTEAEKNQLKAGLKR